MADDKTLVEFEAVIEPWTVVKTADGSQSRASLAKSHLDYFACFGRRKAFPWAFYRPSSRAHFSTDGSKTKPAWRSITAARMLQSRPCNRHRAHL